MDLNSGGTVILENTEGDIEITGWDEERLDVTAYRRRDLPSSAGIYFSGKRFAPPDIDARRSGETVTIRTDVEDGKAGGSVRYILKVPRFVRLDKVSTGGGDIRIADLYGKAAVAARKGRVTIQNFSGSLDIQLESGLVEAEFLDLRLGDDIRVRVDRGDINIRLEPGISGRFSLESPGGSISSEIDLKQPLPARKVAATTGDGEVSFQLTALQGDINIRKVEE